MSNWKQIGDILNSVSVTHTFDKNALVFLNTSDVYDGKILTNEYMDVSILKGQAKKTIKNDDILYSEIRPKNRRFAYVDVENPEDYVVSTKLMVLRNKTSDVLTKYIYYFLTYSDTLDYLQMRAENRIGSFPQITFEIVKELRINIPEKKNQQKIVDILSTLDAKIALNQRINSELEAMAKAVYDYWFVQFDFPYDFAAGRPDPAGKPYKSSGGRMVWSEVLKREVPEGWEVGKLSNWIAINKSGDWGKDEEEGNFTQKVICFRGADINGLNGNGELKPPIRYILEKNHFKFLEPHDMIIEISGGSPTQSTGRLAFITEATIERFEHPLICSNFCKPISLVNKKYLYNFVYYWNSLYEGSVFFGYEGKTSGIKNLLFDSFVSSHYAIRPNEPVAEMFYDFMEPIQKQKQTKLAENQHLTALRDWLLPMLMNGQVRVGGEAH
ncbi:MAG: restriction endonuclease subunit S [Bacteroidia bacterium]